jgi:hypothetical protein
MTTHPPYPPQPPASAYPTAPPWAPPQQAAPVRGEVSPHATPHLRHGQLLVPYPEEMADAARPRPPSWWPVVAWTVFLAVPGAVVASRRAGQARRGRNSPAPYWVAWAVTVAVSAVLGVAVVAIGVPAYLNHREAAITRLVQEKVRSDGQVRSAANSAAASAVCEPAGARDGTGMRRYDCLLTLDDGRSGSLTVTADADGNWTAVRPR